MPIKKTFVEKIGGLIRAGAKIHLEMLTSAQTNKASIAELIRMNEELEHRGEEFKAQMKKLEKSYLYFTMRDKISPKEQYEFGNVGYEILDSLKGTEYHGEFKEALTETVKI
jgi:hypothetical protein